MSLREARPQPPLGEDRDLGEPAPFPQSHHLAGETHSVSQTLNMEGGPEGDAPPAPGLPCVLANAAPQPWGCGSRQRMLAQGEGIGANLSCFFSHSAQVGGSRQLGRTGPVP